MTPLQLTMVTWDYDRMAPLRTGEVVPQGVELNYLTLPPEETFHRTLGAHEFDVAELSLAGYVRERLAGTLPYRALPVFPSRIFRHSALFVRADSALEELDQLAGKRIGVPVEQMTAAVWVRGLLRDEYGIERDAIEWVVPEGDFVAQLADIGSDRAQPNASLERMLLAGEIDALLTVWTPPASRERPARIRTLLRDPRAAEEEYLARTRIFPIMHTLVVRESLLDAHPWLADSLTAACEEAKQRALDRLWEINALAVMVPWLVTEVERTVDTMGADFWPYGLEPNRHVVETLIGYLLKEGQIDHRPEMEDLFVTDGFTSE